VAVVVLAPPGFLMGVPFPAGIRWLTESPDRPGGESAAAIPWVWAANGASSVVASILAALLALSFGFSWVERLGALCYAGAWLALTVPAWRPRIRSPRR
jgi:hypothetical protein